MKSEGGGGSESTPQRSHCGYGVSSFSAGRAQESASPSRRPGDPLPLLGRALREARAHPPFRRHHRGYVVLFHPTL